MSATKFFIFYLILIYACVPVSPPTSSNSSDNANAPITNYDDRIFDADVRSVRLYRNYGQPDDVLKPIAYELGTRGMLMLKFDVLYDDFTSFEMEIIHCDKDWKKSRLAPLDYLSEYNQIPLRSYEYSFDTKVPFTHYFVEIPEVKLSGNYAIMIYPQDQKNNPILIKRFMVFENRTVLQTTVSQSSDVMKRTQNHQIDLKVNYPGINIINPQQELFVSMRQNQRWDNPIENLKPNFLREDLKEVEFRYFDLENNFAAGSEFRFFEISMRNFRGINVATIVENEEVIVAKLNPTKSRGTDAYSYWEDLNGGYITQNKERGGGHLDADYFEVHFELKSPKISEPVFVLGELTNWEMNAENLMKYNEAKGAYEADILLKQGFYNYMYYVDSAEQPYHFEGSHFETENLYEVFVYYRELGARYDRLIGYRNFRTNRN